jgi:hypothetical protein
VLKAFIIIALAVGAIIGGLLFLRNSGTAGMPSKAVLERATKRANAQAAAEDDKPG